MSHVQAFEIFFELIRMTILIRPQTATTYEIGTRGRRPDLTWELTGYRAEIRNELQCMYGAPGQCNVVNADRTIHQGIEAGLGVAVLPAVVARRFARVFAVTPLALRFMREHPDITLDLSFDDRYVNLVEQGIVTLNLDGGVLARLQKSEKPTVPIVYRRRGEEFAPIEMTVLLKRELYPRGQQQAGFSQFVEKLKGMVQ